MSSGFSCHKISNQTLDQNLQYAHDQHQKPAKQINTALLLILIVNICESNKQI